MTINGHELTEDRLTETMDRYALPDYMAGGVYRYLLYRIEPGNFLTAVLSNDLREAVTCADASNIAVLDLWVKFLYNEVPANCWGSPELVHAWLTKREVQS